jgi:hypothetical protein
MFVGYHIHLLKLNEGYEGAKGVFFRCPIKLIQATVAAQFKKVNPDNIINLVWNNKEFFVLL